MKSTEWSRTAAVATVRRDIWRFLTESVESDRELVLMAAALLQMAPREIRTLAQVHFVLSDEVRALLDDMPVLLRRMSNTTAHETETSAERVRGPVIWGETLAARMQSGVPHLYVTAPARRAFDTPENRLLVFVLDALVRVGRRTGWHRASGQGAGAEVRARTAEAMRWLTARSLADVPVATPTPADISRVRSGRRRRRYQHALDVYALYQIYLRRLDRAAVRGAVENHALLTSRDAVLFELVCLFRTISALRQQGWVGPPKGLIRTPLVFRGTRGGETIDVYYQHAPGALTQRSIYRRLQKTHSFGAVGGLIPDIVLRVADEEGRARWVLVEIKGLERRVEESARAAGRDLLAYRRALDPVLSAQDGPYGIGVAWGAELEPVPNDEMLLCTPDQLALALELATAA